ncbi:NAD-dependent epimerase/dehydratase family protein [Peribacillus simplex]
MNILITGEKSYVGNCLKEWLCKWDGKYKVDSITLKNDCWRDIDFSKYDVLFHVAAVVHKRESPEMEESYYKVNKHLALEVANKAKQSGIKQFIFMSSMSVYGLDGEVGDVLVINKNTPCMPNTLYGKSKLDAELELHKLTDDNFVVTIIRAPMIYGPGCPGNYKKLRKLVLNNMIFPKLSNQRSMIFIDNLTEFIRLIMDNKKNGIFYPQNKEYVDTSVLIKLIAKQNSRKLIFSPVLGVIVKILGKRIKVLKKIYGNLVIDSHLSQSDFDYCVFTLEESIKMCEKNK